MKEFRLSTVSERAAGICFTTVMLALFGALLYAIGKDGSLMLLIFSSLCVVLISSLLLIYTVSAFRAGVTVDAEKKLLHVRGPKNYTLDMKDAVLLQTIGQRTGQGTVRILVFSNAEDEIIATVPTMFTFRQGIWADPIAKEIAAAMGIEFKQNVPDWQLDKKKYQEHVKEEAEREKKEAKERRQKKMAYWVQKRKNKLRNDNNAK